MGYERDSYPSDVERQCRIDVLLAKERISPEDLVEFVFLLWDLGQKEPQYAADWNISTKESLGVELLKIHVGLPEESNIDITLESGEEIRSMMNGEKVEWRIGVFDKYPSKFMGFSVVIENKGGKSLLSEQTLEGWPLIRLRNMIHSAYRADIPSSAE